MTGASKIRITYEDLKDPRVDEIIAQQLSAKKRMGINGGPKGMGRGSFVYKRWLYLMMAGIIGSLIAWGLVLISDSYTSPKDKFIEIGNAKYVLSKEAQKYLKVYETSDYEKIRSVIIIEEPHYSLEGQISLYKGLEVFFHDNPPLVSKTIFLSEGFPANRPISVRPLVDVNPDPGEGLIEELLGSFLIPGYIAYEWKYQKNIPIVGIENHEIYQLCTRLWAKMQAGQADDQETAAIWHFTVVARNKTIANTLMEKARNYENPILFVGGLHLRKQDSNDFQQLKNGGFGSALSPEETAYLGEGENSGIYDYLKQEKIGYTFLVPVPNHLESPKDLEKNIGSYTKLFEAQQRGDYREYIEWLISRKSLNGSVTVAPSTEAAAQFAEASDENKDEEKEDKNEDENKEDGKNGGGNNFDPEHHEDQKDNDWYYHWDNNPHDSRGGKQHWDRGNLHDGRKEWSPDGQNWYPK